MDTEAWPAEFKQRMTAWLGDQADAFLGALARRDVGLRLNPLRGDLTTLQAQLPWRVEPVPWCPEGLWLQEDDAAIGTHPYHTAGVYYIQDPSAMAAGVLLDPQPGEWVLDLAAAPGGKATHLAARMQNQGVLIANEVNRRRTSVLAMNLERMGARHAMVFNETPERLAARWDGLFDAVVVDAPCSGEGTFCRDSAAVRDWSLATVQGNAHRQRGIMEQAALLVRPGGRLLYGTCTFAPEEDEGVIAAFLDAHTDFEVAELPTLPGLGRGHPEWVNAPETLRGVGRFWPHTGPGHGHFYALLSRRGEPGDDLPERWAGAAMPGRVLQLFRRTLREVLASELSEEGLYLDTNDDIYITPLDPKLWSGLHVLRPGWWVASQRHGKINPNHALAAALRREDVQEVCDLATDDPLVEQFLRGSFWEDDGRAGFVLVTVEGFPLGWAKRGEGRLRSRYPVHLRR